jgi:hypothetical protein
MKQYAVYIVLAFFLLALPACHGTLHSAAMNGDTATVRALLDEGEPVDKLNMGGFTPLMYGIGHRDVMQLLLERGANPDFKTSQGVTPLHLAVEYRLADGVRALLDAGADPDPGYAELGLGSKGTPLTIAQQKGETAVVALLREAIAKRTPVESRGAAPEKQAPARIASGSDVDTLPSAKTGRKAAGYAVVIGIEQYRQNLPKADFAVQDASLVAKYLEKVLGYPGENVIVLINDRALQSDLTKYFEKWLPNNVEPGSSVFVYYSGHGAPNPKTGDAYLVPYDGDPGFIDETGYSLKRLYAALGKLPAKEIIVAVDSCFSGAGGRSVLAEGTRPLVMNLQTSAVPSKNMTILAAASGEQVSSTYKDKGHGLFTYFMLKAIKDADVVRPDGSLKVADIYSYMKPQVESIARKKYNSEQTPQLIEAKHK